MREIIQKETNPHNKMAESFLNIKLSGKGNILSYSGGQLKLSKNFEKRLGDKGLLKRDVVEIAGMIRDKIEANIRNAKTFTGRPVAPLKPSTIKRKKHSRPLYETGKLASSVMVETKGSAAVVRLKADRAEIGGYLQVGRSDMKARPFFGITKKDLSMFTKSVITDRLFKKENRLSGFQNLQRRAV